MNRGSSRGRGKRWDCAKGKETRLEMWPGPLQTTLTSDTACISSASRSGGWKPALRLEDSPVVQAGEAGGLQGRGHGWSQSCLGKDCQVLATGSGVKGREESG